MISVQKRDKSVSTKTGRLGGGGTQSESVEVEGGEQVKTFITRFPVGTTQGNKDISHTVF